jgi:hypothetical protein
VRGGFPAIVRGAVIAWAVGLLGTGATFTIAAPETVTVEVTANITQPVAAAAAEAVWVRVGGAGADGFAGTGLVSV